MGGPVVGGFKVYADVVVRILAAVVDDWEYGSLDVIRVDTSGGCLVGEGGLDIGGEG